MIIHLDFVPIHNDLIFIETDKFIVYENKTSRTKKKQAYKENVFIPMKIIIFILC